jgi:hypothetical protein
MSPVLLLLQVVIYPNYKGIEGERDFQRPSIVIDKNEIYQTIPNTNIRDYTKPSYTIERDPNCRPVTPRSRYLIDMEDPLE